MSAWDSVSTEAAGRVCRSMSELRESGESLEDAFVRIVGAEHPMERLDWL